MNRCAWLLASCLSAPVIAAGTGPLKFSVPPGWVDLSPGAPGANFERLPPAMREKLGTSGSVFLAMDLDHPAGGFFANVSGTLIGPVNFDDPDYVSQLSKVMASTGMTDLVVEPCVVQQVNCVRLRGDRQAPNGLAFRQLIFVFPAGTHVGQLVFSASAARFADYEPVFTRAAEATTGITPRKRAGAAIAKAAISAAVCGLAAFAWYAWFKRNKAADRTG